MDGLNIHHNELNQALFDKSGSKSLEKNLDAPIDLKRPSQIEPLEHNQNYKELLPQNELNRPIDVNSEKIGLTDEQKSELKNSTGWSDDVIDSIKTEAEAQVYKNANLVEVNGNLERTDIDWDAKIPKDKIDRMRSMYGTEVADKWADKTNMDLIKEGKAPYGPDGERINLHHIGQRYDSPLAELTNTEHKQYDGILHDKLKKSEIERPVFKTERQQYWQARYETLQN